jgi:putative redox protein
MTAMPRIAHAALDSASGYACAIRAGHHELTADEPVASGGTDRGPAPYQLLVASLAACTSITLRMYAERKGWTLGAIDVDVTLDKDDAGAAHIARVISFGAPVTDEQRARLAEIAEKTPVTKTLRAGATIATELR